MSTLIRARRPFARSAIGAGSDAVIAGVWLPSGSILTRVRGEVSMVAPTEMLLSQVCVYGVEGWILPVDDPDTVTLMDALWDSHVPKDTSAFVLDLDTAAADSTAFYEPGMIAWEFLFDLGVDARRMLHRHKFCSAANAAIGFRQDVETPFTEHWFAGAIERIDMKRSIRVNGPSLAVFAATAPLTTMTSASAAVGAMDENDWGRIKYIDSVMELAMQDLLGLVETGAETPWEDAAILLKDYMDPLVLEANAGTLFANTWLASGELVFDVVVPGRIPTRTLTGGR